MTVKRATVKAPIVVCVLYARNGSWRLMPIPAEGDCPAELDTGFDCASPFVLVKAEFQAVFPAATFMTLSQAFDLDP